METLYELLVILFFWVLPGSFADSAQAVWWWDWRGFMFSVHRKWMWGTVGRKRHRRSERFQFKGGSLRLRYIWAPPHPGREGQPLSARLRPCVEPA